eukprot:scaffold304_cov248-Pinguiococcus_pyrenoidosus.AAC.23
MGRLAKSPAEYPPRRPACGSGTGIDVARLSLRFASTVDTEEFRLGMWQGQTRDGTEWDGTGRDGSGRVGTGRDGEKDIGAMAPRSTYHPDGMGSSLEEASQQASLPFLPRTCPPSREHIAFPSTSTLRKKNVEGPNESAVLSAVSATVPEGKHFRDHHPREGTDRYRETKHEATQEEHDGHPAPVLHVCKANEEDQDRHRHGTEYQRLDASELVDVDQRDCLRNEFANAEAHVPKQPLALRLQPGLLEKRRAVVEHRLGPRRLLPEREAEHNEERTLHQPSSGHQNVRPRRRRVATRIFVGRRRLAFAVERVADALTFLRERTRERTSHGKQGSLGPRTHLARTFLGAEREREHLHRLAHFSAHDKISRRLREQGQAQADNQRRDEAQAQHGAPLRFAV